MAWLIGYDSIKEPVLIDKFCLIVGKALCLASDFESKCEFVYKAIKLNSELDEEDPKLLDSMQRLLKKLEYYSLGKMITDLQNLKITQGDVMLIERAKDARNYIAHEGALLGLLSEVNANDIEKKLLHLRREISFLIKGDNLISSWVYEIEDKEPAPSEIQRLYPKWIKKWVFG